MIGLGALIAAITANQPGGLEPGQSAISTSLSGMFFAQLAIGVLGVLLITGEYSTGMIRSSLTVVPRRLPMLWGKLGSLKRCIWKNLQWIWNRQRISCWLRSGCSWP